MKWLCSLALVCLLLLALPLSSLAGEVPTTMRVAFTSPADLALYPLQINDRDMLSILDLVYESLVIIDDDRKPAPGLAESWSTTNGTTWTFTLREDVYFHDGKVLTAHDVKATMDTIKVLSEMDVPDNEKGLYCKMPSIIKKWEAEDDHTLTVTAEIPYYGLLYAMTFPVLQAQTLGQANPPGTGPYRLEYYNPGNEIWLAGNQNWYGPAPHVSEITCQWYPSVEEALVAFEAEEVDIVMTRSASAVRYRGTASNRASSYDFSTRQLECLIINYSSRNAANDPEIRKAIAYAIDTSRLVSSTYQGLATSTDTLQSPSSWLYYDDNLVLPSYAYSMEKAVEILDKAGWTSTNDKGVRYRITEGGDVKELSVRLNYYDEAGNSLRKEAANEIARMLREVGFSVQLGGYSFENAQQKLATNVRDYDLFLCAFNFDVVPDPNFLLLSNGYANYAGNRSDDMNKLCQELRKSAPSAAEGDTTPYLTLLENAFADRWADIQVQAAEELALIPLYWRDGLVITRYPYSSIRDIREFELLRSINLYR